MYGFDGELSAVLVCHSAAKQSRDSRKLLEPDKTAANYFYFPIYIKTADNLSVSVFTSAKQTSNNIYFSKNLRSEMPKLESSFSSRVKRLQTAAGIAPVKNYISTASLLSKTP